MGKSDTHKAAPAKHTPQPVQRANGAAVDQAPEAAQPVHNSPPLVFHQSAQRARAVQRMQRTLGNNQVQRLLNGSKSASLGSNGVVNDEPNVVPPMAQRATATANDPPQDVPTEAEKAAALQAAAQAETAAQATAAKGAEQAGKTKAAGVIEKTAGKAAKQQAVAASAAAKAVAQEGKAAAKGAGNTDPAVKKAKPAIVVDGGAAAKAIDAAAAANGKAPSVPSKDPAFQAVVAKIKGTAAKQQAHPSAKSKADAAHAAAISPAAELTGKAQAGQVGNMQQAPTPPFDAAGFKAKLMERIASMAPKTAEEADNFKEGDKLGGVKGEMQGNVAQEQQKSQGPLQQQTAAEPNAGSIEGKPVTPLQPNQPGAPPSVAGAAGAAPKPKTTAEVEAPLREDNKQIDQKMAEADIGEEQLQKGNEPAFQSALDAKQEAKEHAQTGPQEFRQAEQGQIVAAQAEAGTTAQAGVLGMHAARGAILQQIGGRQTQTKSKDEEERARIAADIQNIYNETKTSVEGKLGGLDAKINQAFDEGAAAAKKTFEDYVDARMNAYKERRYGGWFGWARWASDKIGGMPSEVNAFYADGRKRYLDQMDAVINRVVEIIGKTIGESKAEIARGKQRIQEYVAKLPANLRRVGNQSATEMQSQFESLEQSVDSKQDDLINSLASKYQENVQAIDARIQELKAANKGLVSKALDAVVGVIKTILQLKDLLLSVLASAANAIGKIIKDPIGFLGNLLGGVKQGLMNFVGNIGTHLKKGLMTWLFGELAAGGIEIPKSFDLKGILTLVMQLLGLTWQAIRAQAVKILGERVVSALEGAFEIFKIVKDQGIGGLWEFIKDKLGDLKEMVLGGIKDMVITQVIQAGIQWLLGILGGPAGAFIKAAKAIIDIVMWFVNNGSRVAALVQSVIGSVNAIASGSVAQAAKYIEESLGNAVPVMIGFLASLLGLGNLGQKIKGIIQKIQQPVQKAVGWVLGKAKSFASKIMGKVKGFAGKVSQKVKQKLGIKDKPPEQRLKEGMALGVSSINKLKNKPVVGEAMLRPILSGIRRFKGLSVLEPVKQDGYWAVHGEVQRAIAKTSVKADGDKASDTNVVTKDMPIKVFSTLIKGQDSFVAVVTEVNVEQKRFKWQSVNLKTPRTGVFLFDQINKKWAKGHASQVGLSEDKLKEENKKETWSDIETARKVLNYRHHGAQTNTPGKQWEHIIENSAGGAHSSTNLALTDSTLNNELGHWFNKPYASYDAPPGLSGTNGMKLRDFLKDKERVLHIAWKTHAYNKLGLRFVPRRSERGRWMELVKR